MYVIIAILGLFAYHHIITVCNLVFISVDVNYVGMAQMPASCNTSSELTNYQVIGICM